MSTLASVVVSLGLNSASYRDGLKKSQKQSQSFASSVKSDLKGAATAFAAVSVAAAASLTVMAKKQLAAIDTNVKFARQVDANVESLVGLQYAVGQTSTATDKEFNTALQRQARRVADAAAGNKGLQATFKELGLSVESLVNMRSDQQFLAIADAMQKVENRNQRLLLTQRVYDTEGVKLVNTLTQGSAALLEYQRNAEALGLTYSEFEASQIEAANDAIDNLQRSTQGLAQQVTISLAPGIRAMAEYLQEASGDAKGLETVLLRTVEQGVAGFGWLAEGVWYFRVGLLTISNVLDSLHYSFLKFGPDIANIFIDIGQDITQTLIYPLQALFDALAEFNDTAADAAQTLREFGQFEELNPYDNEKIAAARDSFFASTDSLVAMIAAGGPKDKILAFLEEYKAKAEAISNTPLAPKQPITTGGALDDGTADAAKLAAATQTKIDKLRESLRSEKEVIEQQHAERLSLLDSWVAEDYSRWSQYDTLRLKTEQDYQEQLTALAKKGTDDRSALVNASMVLQSSAVTTSLGTITQALRDGGKEQTLAYKVLFAAQQAAAIPGMIVATEEGAAKALSLGPIAGPIASGAIKALGYASVGIVAGQSLAGMAHDGIDNVPREGTWLLDRGERVVDSRTNADLKNYLSNQGQGGTTINYSPTFIIEDANNLDPEELAEAAHNLMIKDAAENGKVTQALRGAI